MNMNFDKPNKISSNGKFIIRDNELWLEFNTIEECRKFLEENHIEFDEQEINSIKVDIKNGN